ncbi:hypothetical protein CfE428DRAFT_1023 [Chthoniobacter flavus Ellin428]|uniref:Uncharacterized protein n=1 Tax=Chthoniobacter flavus Ellin428 TaxID=497964 RepID=B4CWI6_9BACT|nr:hypothetical protein CfE428DRAFT_1023 [Chthoniobacter flavus Ellin428]
MLVQHRPRSADANERRRRILNFRTDPAHLGKNGRMKA